MKNFDLADFLSNKPHGLKPWELLIMDKVLKYMIPFNGPHGFKIKNCRPKDIAISIPNKRVNHNHLKGIHAGAIITLGEFCSGLCLLTEFSAKKYRLILKELRSEYFYQGKTDLEGRCKVSAQDVQKIRDTLVNEPKVLTEQVTEIYDKEENLVAKVYATWQLKSWKSVQTKS